MFGYVFMGLVGGSVAGTLWGPPAGVIAAVALVVIGVLYDKAYT